MLAILYVADFLDVMVILWDLHSSLLFLQITQTDEQNLRELMNLLKVNLSHTFILQD